MTNLIAANPLTVPQSVDAVAPLHELLNVAHSRPFSMLFGNYSWALGAAGGLTLVWAIYVIAGRRRGLEYRYALPLAVALIVAGFLNVLSEVQQPSRLIYGYLFGWEHWATAIIKYGIILLPIYLALCWWLSFQAMDREALAKSIERLPSTMRFLADFFSLWSRHYSVLDSTPSRRGIISVLVALSLFAPIYSGVFLMNEHGVAIWNTPAQPLIFITTAAAKGAMLMLVVVPIMAWLAVGRKPEVKVEPLRWGAAISIALAAVIWFGWLWWMGRFGSVEELRAAQLYMGPHASHVFWQWTLPGVIVPLVLLVTPLGRKRWAQVIALLGIMWGSYSVRVLILVGGEALIRSGAGYQKFTPSSEVLLYTGFSVLAALGVLAAQLLLLPDKHDPDLNTPTR
jgi:formate-dependent nitrite reductase membrane component NrfD